MPYRVLISLAVAISRRKLVSAPELCLATELTDVWTSANLRLLLPVAALELDEAAMIQHGA